MYHRFGDGAFPSTNTTLEQFEAHLAELTTGDYNVVGLPEIAAALRDGRALPDRTVGISIDDAYLSVYTEAWPRLRDAGLPFTVFVATDPIDRGAATYMSWDQLREMRDGGVTIGSQTATHPRMAAGTTAEAADELTRSNARFAAELGAAPTLFAYPYGEASLAVEKTVREHGFVAAFGQHSGVIGSTGDIFYLPRFAMNETYGSLKRFRLAVNALPLPVIDLTPEDHVVTTANPPAMGFTVTADLSGLEFLGCFASHEGKAMVERIGEHRFEVRVGTPFPKGRTRLNCTAPAGDGRWRWLGRQFFVP